MGFKINPDLNSPLGFDGIFNPGIYFISVTIDNRVVKKKFIEEEHLLSEKGITFYKPDKNSICILPAGMELPTTGQYGPKGVVRKKVPECKLPASS